MLVINKLTAPGGIKRMDIHPNTIYVILRDGTEILYTNNREKEISDNGGDYPHIVKAKTAS